MHIEPKPATLGAVKRPILRVGLCSLLYLAVFVFVLFNSFQYVSPGEPGYDPDSARWSEFFGVLLNILAFPFLTLVYIVPGIPNAFCRPVSLLSIVANSLLWGYGMAFLARRLEKRVKGEKPGRGTRR